MQVLNNPAGDPLVGVSFILEQLATGGCLRNAFLAFLGQTFLARPCRGCDHCAKHAGCSYSVDSPPLALGAAGARQRIV